MPLPFILFYVLSFLLKEKKYMWFYSYVYSDIEFAFPIAFYYFFWMDINFFFLLCLLSVFTLCWCFDLTSRLEGVSFLWTILFRDFFFFFLLLEQVFTLLMGSDIRIPKSKEKCQNMLKEFTHLLLQARIHLFIYSVLRLSNHPPILLSGIHGAP